MTGYADAVVSMPDLTTAPSEPRPVVVALHGLRGRADWSCTIARQLFESRAFVLCPTGKALPPSTPRDKEWPRFTFADAHSTELEIGAGLAALRAAYGASVDGRAPVLYGHSLGAMHAATIALAAPDAWPRVVLSEGGYSAFGAGARSFAKRGGKRVVFACGTQSCADGAKGAAAALNASGAGARVGFAPGAGHHSYGLIVDVMADQMSWLLEGDERYRVTPM